jgi:hypothetical protein
MHNAKYKSRTVVACILHCAFCMSTIAAAEIIDRVLAVVGGVVITQSDVNAAFDLGLASPGQTDDPVAAVLSQLIDRQLMLAEVERYAPPEPAPEALERAAAAVRARFASEQALTAALARSGLDAPRLRQLLRDQLRIDAYLDQRFNTTPDRRPALLGEWLSGLRRRADINYLYVQRR